MDWYTVHSSSGLTVGITDSGAAEQVSRLRVTIIIRYVRQKEKTNFNQSVQLNSIDCRCAGDYNQLRNTLTSAPSALILGLILQLLPLVIVENWP